MIALSVGLRVGISQAAEGDAIGGATASVVR